MTKIYGIDEYKHIVFNPKMTSNPIETAIKINNKEKDGDSWQLSHIVPCTEYEWVAVFSRWNGERELLTNK